MAPMVRSLWVVLVFAALLIGCSSKSDSDSPQRPAPSAGNGPQNTEQAAIYTQMGRGERYPWDQRPLKCLAPGAPQIGPCKPPDNWPTRARTIHYISNLYLNETFPLLERYLTDLVASKKRFGDGTYAEEAIFSAFVQIMSGPTAEQTAPQFNAEWQKAVPNSQFLVLADYARLYRRAWDARGSGYADTVSPESWELFRIRLNDAERVLSKAPEQLRNSPEWYMAKLAVELDLGDHEDQAREVFELAIKKWPTYSKFYEFMVKGMLPKWGGSWAKVESFIRISTDSQPAAEGKSLYARLYIALIPDRAAVDGSYDWSMMKTSFEDAIARFPAAKYKNLYASFACQTRDRPQFAHAMSMIPQDQLIPAWWLDGASYDACMRWAGI